VSSVLREPHGNIPADSILRNHCRENFKSYIVLLSPSPKFGVKSSHIFMWLLSLTCQDKLFVNKEHALDSALYLPQLLQSQSLDSFNWRILLCLRVITINPGVVTSNNPGQEGSPTFAAHLLSLCLFHGAGTTPKSVYPPSCIKFCMTSKIC
jgi:hypothetical protein